MSQPFGTRARYRPIVLTDGADWGITFRPRGGGDWPAGASLKIVFSSGAEWSASISGPNAVFAVDKAQTALIPDVSTSYRMVYTDSTGLDLVPYVGPVKRNVTVA